MKARFQVLLSAGSAMMLSCSAHAVLTGLVVTQEPAPPAAPPTGGPRTVYNVYAEFDNPSDRVNMWGGGGELGSGIIQNVLADGMTLGTGFTQIGGPSGQIAPYSPSGSDLWDTYMTIGVLDGWLAPGGVDATTVIPGTPVFIAGTTWTAPFDGGGVFITPEDIQGRADFRVIGNDTNLRVLLMNLVVNQGQHVQGTIGVSWGVDGVNGSGVVTSGLTFSSIPAPGAWALLACSGLVSMRRRRNGGMS